jgi:hypothetical protein
MDVIAEHRLVATFPDGGSGPVVLRVGRPYAHPKGDHACPVQAEGLRLWQGRNEIYGVGTWHALMLGLRFLRSMLAAEAGRGAVFHWEDGEHAVSVEELFVLGPIE